MAWLVLFFAGIFEVIWAFYMKQSQGFTKLIPSVITLIAMVASVVLLAISMKSLPLGTAYTVWTGIGAIGAFLVGLFILGEPASILRLTSATFIVLGLLLMKISSS